MSRIDTHDFTSVTHLMDTFQFLIHHQGITQFGLVKTATGWTLSYIFLNLEEPNAAA